MYPLTKNENITFCVVDMYKLVVPSLPNTSERAITFPRVQVFRKHVLALTFAVAVRLMQRVVQRLRAFTRSLSLSFWPNVPVKTVLLCSLPRVYVRKRGTENIPLYCSLGSKHHCALASACERKLDYCVRVRGAVHTHTHTQQTPHTRCAGRVPNNHR